MSNTYTVMCLCIGDSGGQLAMMSLLSRERCCLRSNWGIFVSSDGADAAHLLSVTRPGSE